MKKNRLFLSLSFHLSPFVSCGLFFVNGFCCCCLDIIACWSACCRSVTLNAHRYISSGVLMRIKKSNTHSSAAVACQNDSLFFVSLLFQSFVVFFHSYIFNLASAACLVTARWNLSFVHELGHSRGLFRSILSAVCACMRVNQMCLCASILFSVISSNIWTGATLHLHCANERWIFYIYECALTHSLTQTHRNLLTFN